MTLQPVKLFRVPDVAANGKKIPRKMKLKISRWSGSRVGYRSNILAFSAFVASIMVRSYINGVNGAVKTREFESDVKLPPHIL
jgi:hypothetical protein